MKNFRMKFLFWYLIIVVAIYAHITLVIWPFLSHVKDRFHYFEPQYILPFAIPIALIPFIFVIYFPNNKFSKFILRVKKVFKIIFSIIAGIWLTWYSLFLIFMYILPYPRMTNEIIYDAFSLVKQDTTITKKIGPIIDYEDPTSSVIGDKIAKLCFVVKSKKSDATVYIKMHMDKKWITDTIILIK